MLDKDRLNTWIEDYCVQVKNNSVKDSYKVATFREIATRLKMLLDDNDFDVDNLRIERRKIIAEINNMFRNIDEL